ncbi:MAG: O-antigen ligase family protein, partial [Dehalococcoidia bacterium]|nr:O-antigen ligase family protein [Dehalococcoidia bacterium]
MFLLLSGVAIALTGSWITWVGAVFGFALTFFLSDLSNLKTLSQIRLVRLIGLAVPVVLVALVAVISVIPPLGAAKNPLYTQAKNLPREVQLPFVPSWKISISAFRDSPFWGTGPATYAFGFTNYKPVEFNSLKVWNLRFDSSFNEYLQTLATLGGFGLLALLSLAALFISAASPVILSAAKDLSRLRDTSNETTTHNNQLALAVSGLTFFIILALHPSSLPLWIIGILILASFMVISREDRDRLSGNRTGLNDLKDRVLRIAGFSVSDSTETIKMDALPGVLRTISLALVLFAFFFGGKITLADYHHRLALNAVVQNQGLVTYNQLIAAEKLNPVNDLYRTDLAQVNFALANAIASAK